MKSIRKRFPFAAAVFIGLLLCASQQPTEPEEEYGAVGELNTIETANSTSVTNKQKEAVGSDLSCSEWIRSIVHPGDRSNNLQISSAYGAERYKPINQLLNLKENLPTEDPKVSSSETRLDGTRVLACPVGG